MSNDIINIKGMSNGLLISLSPSEEWQTITQELAARLDEKASFFAGAKVIVDTGERPVPKYELSSLKALLERRNMSLMVVQSASQTTLESALALDLRTQSTAPDKPISGEQDVPISSEESGTVGVMIRRTLRSGRTVTSRGHVVVYGDVNPGAKIIAEGDVVVWGRLRGTVHAGANGNTDAIVCALDMNPNQLRIAHYIATSPSDKRRKVVPEVARVRDNQIIVEAWE